MPELFIKTLHCNEFRDAHYDNSNHGSFNNRKKKDKGNTKSRFTMNPVPSMRDYLRHAPYDKLDLLKCHCVIIKQIG